MTISIEESKTLKQLISKYVTSIVLAVEKNDPEIAMPYMAELAAFILIITDLDELMESYGETPTKDYFDA